MSKVRQRISEYGYLERITVNGGSHGSHKSFRNWYLGKPNFMVNIFHLPEKYWGKHIRIKIEVAEPNYDFGLEAQIATAIENIERELTRLNNLIEENKDIADCPGIIRLMEAHMALKKSLDYFLSLQEVVIKKNSKTNNKKESEEK